MPAEKHTGHFIDLAERRAHAADLTKQLHARQRDARIDALRPRLYGYDDGSVTYVHTDGTTHELQDTPDLAMNIIMMCEQYFTPASQSGVVLCKCCANCTTGVAVRWVGAPEKPEPDPEGSTYHQCVDCQGVLHCHAPF